MVVKESILSKSHAPGKKKKTFIFLYFALISALSQCWQSGENHSQLKHDIDAIDFRKANYKTVSLQPLSNDVYANIWLSGFQSNVVSMKADKAFPSSGFIMAQFMGEQLCNSNIVSFIIFKFCFFLVHPEGNCVGWKSLRIMK